MKILETTIRQQAFFPMAALLAVMAVAGIGTAHAVPCTVATVYTNPDPTLTHATDCGMGTGANDNEGAINGLAPGGFDDWSFAYRLNREEGGLEAETSSHDITLGLTFDLEFTAGGWTISSGSLDLGLLDLLLVMKDGSSGEPGVNPPNGPQWFWFLVDNAASSCLGGLCGTWDMYGSAANPGVKNISHLTLYVREGEGGDDPRCPDGICQVPEPQSLALVGLGLLGLLAVRRRLMS